METPTPHPILPVSEYDAQFIGRTSVNFLLHFAQALDIERVEAAFWEVLEHYNTFASRVVQDGPEAFSIQYDPFAPTFRVAKTLTNWIRETDFTSKGVDILIDEVESIPGGPQITVVLTPVPDGMVLGLSISHVLVDGLSLGLLIASWSKIIHGEDFPRPSPQRIFPHIPNAREVTSPQPPPPPAEWPLPSWVEARRKQRMIPNFHRTLYFTHEEVAGIRREATSDETDFKILLAHLLKERALAMAPASDVIIVIIPSDLRLDHPDVDPLYIGNALSQGVCVFSKAELRDCSLAEISSRISATVRNARDPEHLREIIKVGPTGIIYKLPPTIDKSEVLPEACVIASAATTESYSEVLASINFGSGPPTCYLAPMDLASSVFVCPEGGRIRADLSSMHPIADK